MGLSIERRPLHGYVLVLSGSAAALLVSSVATTPLGSAVAVAVAAVALTIVQMLPIPIRRGSEMETVGFEEAILLPMYLVLPMGGVLLAMFASLLAWQLLARQSLIKAAFNGSQMLLAVGAGAGVVALCGGPSTGLGPGSAPVLIATLGVATMVVVNQLLFAGLLTLARGSRFGATLLEDLPMKLSILGVTISFGVLVTPALEQRSPLLFAAVVLFAFLHASGRVLMCGINPDDAITELRDATDQLGEDMPVVRIADRVARAACEIQGACGAQVRLRPPRDGDGHQVTRAEQEELVFETGERGRLVAALQLRSGSRRIGELRVWRDPRQVSRSMVQKQRDRAMLELLARHASVALAKAALAQEATRHVRTMAQVFEHSNESFVVVDGTGIVMAWNPAMTALTGMRSAQMLGRPIEVVSPELAQLVARGQSGIAPAALTTARGERRVVRAAFARVEPEEQASSPRDTWVLALHDTTRAHEAERLKSDFVATVSHELRTPLTTIRGFLETMRRDDLHLEPEQVDAFLDIMRSEALRLDRLINDLLDSSAIEAGRPPSVRIRTMDLADQVRVAVASFRTAHPEVMVRYPDDFDEPTLVRGDPDRLQQVLLNLLQNARRHGLSDRPIEVHIHRERYGRVGIAIRDHGRGIGEEDQTHIFERFFFTADSATRTGGGAGLGLFICRRLMMAMDGDIEVISAPGEGATFTLRLPGMARRTRTITGSRTPAGLVGS